MLEVNHDDMFSKRSILILLITTKCLFLIIHATSYFVEKEFKITKLYNNSVLCVRNHFFGVCAYCSV